VEEREVRDRGREAKRQGRAKAKAFNVEALRAEVSGAEKEPRSYWINF